MANATEISSPAVDKKRSFITEIKLTIHSVMLFISISFMYHLHAISSHAR